MVLLDIAIQHIVVAVVFLRGPAELGPLKADKRNQVGVVRVTGNRVAMTHRILGIPPALGGIALSVVSKEEKVELRDIARIVAGRGRGQCTAAGIQHRQREHERIEGPGGVHMRIAKQDLFFPVRRQGTPLLDTGGSTTLPPPVDSRHQGNRPGNLSLL